MTDFKKADSRLNENWGAVETEEKFNEVMDLLAKQSAKQTFVDLLKTPGGFEFEMNREGKRKPPHMLEDGDELMGTFCLPVMPYEAMVLLQIMTRKGGEISDSGEDPFPYLMGKLEIFRWQPEKKGFG
tara:strand:+ start:1478 stop:1861 length:384 start_codon:yes stop_codon:yes gene_type:complete